ncbi:hypothetical protein J4228_04310 [Candidatus Woesearchaeota archaeon]|nr:hypothetical protein [Candidatus Woesearchaeota archaeon]
MDVFKELKDIQLAEDKRSNEIIEKQENEIAQNGIEHYSQMYKQDNTTGMWTKR